MRTVLKVGQPEIRQQVEDVLQEQVDLVADGQLALVHEAQVHGDAGELPPETREAVELLGHVLRERAGRRVFHFAAQDPDEHMAN